jgi:hypothetical protein
VGFTQALNLAGLIVMAIPAVQFFNEAREASNAWEGAEARGAKAREALFGRARMDENAPDIVHILLDGYARQDILQDFFLYDNSPFLDTLKSMGFKVADRAQTPYYATFYVMSSVFNSQYMADIIPETFKDAPASKAASARAYVRARVQKSNVILELKKNGYFIANNKSEFSPMWIRKTDRTFFNQKGVFNSLETNILTQSTFGIILHGVTSADILRAIFDNENEKNLPSPHFLFLHALAPHAPFDITAEGLSPGPAGIGRRLTEANAFVRDDPVRREIYRKGYLEKLKFTNTVVLPYIRDLIANHKRPLIIILHGDHGSALYLHNNQVKKTCLRERFSPMLAVYSSDGRLQESLPQDMNLVNIYRLIFNIYFNTETPLLKSYSYFPTNEDTIGLLPLDEADLERPCTPTP